VKSIWGGNKLGENQIDPKVSRRKFLRTTGKVVAGGAVVVSGFGFLSACAPNSNGQQKEVNPKKGNYIPIGNESKFNNIKEPIKVDYHIKLKDGWTEQERKGFVYVTKDDTNELLIMSPTCTHLGCTVPFASEAEQASQDNLEFRCPCHNGQYNDQGINIGGPPPRPLDIFEPVILEGKVYIDILSPVERSS
jgi:menaquinol-cytochrome c reductase iron-sulfur subunit